MSDWFDEVGLTYARNFEAVEELRQAFEAQRVSIQESLASELERVVKVSREVRNKEVFRNHAKIELYVSGTYHDRYAGWRRKSGKGERHCEGLAIQLALPDSHDKFGLLVRGFSRIKSSPSRKMLGATVPEEETTDLDDSLGPFVIDAQSSWTFVQLATVSCEDERFKVEELWGLLEPSVEAFQKIEEWVCGKTSSLFE